MCCAPAFSVPDGEQYVALTCHEFVASDWRASEMFLVVWFEDFNRDIMGFRPFFRQCVYSYCAARYDGGEGEVVLSEDLSDVGMFYASAAYDCEFHAFND